MLSLKMSWASGIEGQIVDIDQEAKEYTINDVDYDVETIVHFKDVIGYTNLSTRLINDEFLGTILVTLGY